MQRLPTSQRVKLGLLAVALLWACADDSKPAETARGTSPVAEPEENYDDPKRPSDAKIVGVLLKKYEACQDDGKVWVPNKPLVSEDYKIMAGRCGAPLVTDWCCTAKTLRKRFPEAEAIGKDMPKLSEAGYAIYGCSHPEDGVTIVHMLKKDGPRISYNGIKVVDDTDTELRLLQTSTVTSTTTTSTATASSATTTSGSSCKETLPSILSPDAEEENEDE